MQMDEYAFLWSCIHGNLKLAQWLHSLGDVNIHIMNDYLFEFSPKEIITWLNTL